MTAPEDPTRLGPPPEPILLKRPWAAAAAAIVCLTPVAINGMFSPGTPLLDLGLGTALMTVCILTIVGFGLLPTMAALPFILLRAPLTIDFGSWRGPIGLWFPGAVLFLGLRACYLARSAATRALPRTFEQPQAV